MMTRRVFLKGGSLALVSLGFAPAFIARTAKAAEARKKVLVAIFQRGAVDGLNMVVPYGDKAYYQSRPSIAIPRPHENEGAVDLDGFFGLHPRMAPLADIFHRNEMAVVHACGSPDETRSHFDAQDYMESATPGVKSTRDGWLNRYLHQKEHENASPFRAVALATQLPRTLQGVAPALAINQLNQFGVHAGRATDSMESTFEAQYAAAADSLLAPAGKEAFDAVKMLKNSDPNSYAPANGADYPRSGFGDAMRQIAQLVKSDLGLEVAFTELSGWDTHVQQGNSTGQLANRLDDFAKGLAAFNTDLGDRMADVVVVTMSEFGRAVNENGNRGTDHGHGNAMMIFGGPVKGGKVYGKWPGLAVDQRWEGRDLAITTDFRNVFADLVAGHLGAKDVSPIFPGYTYKGPIGFLRT
ncbi:MAG TPA: DUF1501 domain-containing protein [Vicinamibacterales bacterium]|nr:DUF1501 domain-containing protein [Vicinamibacterales bacterium]